MPLGPAGTSQFPGNAQNAQLVTCAGTERVHTHKHTHSCSSILSHTNMFVHSFKVTCSHALGPGLAFSLTHSHADIHTLPHYLKHANTYTHMCHLVNAHTHTAHTPLHSLSLTLTCSHLHTTGPRTFSHAWPLTFHSPSRYTTHSTHTLLLSHTLTLLHCLMILTLPFRHAHFHTRTPSQGCPPGLPLLAHS